jgi:surface protein
MVKNILFTLLFVFAMAGCNNEDTDKPIATERLLYLDKNGVTVKCNTWAEVGQSEELDGIIYKIVDEEMLRLLVKVGGDVALTVCTTKVTDMQNMFEDYYYTQDISFWDVSNVTNMKRMFYGAYRFNPDISSWDVSNVMDMSGMFRHSRFNQDISSWDVSNVTDMNRMFRDTPFNQDIGSWDVENVTKCSGFSWDTPRWTLPKPNFTNCDP